VRLACIEEKNRNQKTNTNQNQPTTNSEKNMIVRFRSKTLYMTSANVLNSRKKEKQGRVSDKIKENRKNKRP